MFSSLKKFALILALQVSSPVLLGDALAQESAKKVAPHAKAPQNTGHNPAKAQDRVGSTNFASQVQSGPASPEVAEFGSWTINCMPQSQDAKAHNCIAKVTILRSKEDTRPILFVNLIKTGATTTFLIQTPTTVELKPGVNVELGKSSPRHIDYISCEPALCSAALPFDEALSQELASATTALTKWTGLSAGEVRVEYALQGTKEAIAYLAAR